MPIYTQTDPKNTDNGSSSTYERTRVISKPKLNKLVILSIGVITLLLLVIIAQNVFMNKTYKQEIVSDIPLLESENAPLDVSRNNIQVPSKPQAYTKPVPLSTNYVQPQPIPKAAPQGYSQTSEASSKTQTGTVTQNSIITRTIYVPAGTGVGINLETTLSSAISMVGDLVTASLASPIVVASDIIAPTGSRLTGSVVTSVPARRLRVGDPGSLGIRFADIRTPNGKHYPLSTTYNIRGATGGERLAKGIGKTAIGAGAGAALGTAIGAIAGGMPGRGAWSGAAIGGGVGAATAILSKGDEAVLSSGTKLNLVSEQSFSAVIDSQ